MELETHSARQRTGPGSGGGGGMLPSVESSLFINEIAEAVVAVLDPRELIAVTADKVRQLLDADDASLLLLDRDTGALSFEVASGEGGPRKCLKLERGQGVGGWVAEHGKPALVDDVRSDPRFTVGALRDFEVRSVVAVPLFIGNELCGVLEAVNTEQSGVFARGALEALLWLAPHVALAVKNSLTNAELVRSHEAVLRSNEGLEGKVRERTEQIARAKQEWERTFDSIREPLFLIDDYVIRRSNTAVAELAGLPVRAVVGKRCYEVLGGRKSPCPGCPLAAGEKAGETTLKGRVYRASYFPLEGGGQVAHYRDVTDSLRLEERLRESQRMASVGQLAAGAAHEINNPLGFLISNLTTLEGYLDDIRKTFSRVAVLQSLAQSGQKERALELLSKGELVAPGALEALEEAPQILSESRAGGHRVHEIVKALKELAAHDTPDRRTSEDPWVVLERAAKRAGTDRVVDAGHELVRVSVEPLQLELAFANVLKNAMQASDEQAPIRVGVEKDGEWVLITIADAGCGMSPEVRARAFDPFFTTRGVGGGLGLGLTAAYGIVTRHGGSIAIDSEPGGGTEVKIRLPAV